MRKRNDLEQVLDECNTFAMGDDEGGISPERRKISTLAEVAVMKSHLSLKWHIYFHLGLL